MCIYFNSHKKNWEARGTLWDFAQAENSNLLGHGSPTFLCQRATPVIVLLSAGSRATRGKITVSGGPKCLNYCNIFIVHTQFTNVTAGRWSETHVLGRDYVVGCVVPDVSKVRSVPSSSIKQSILKLLIPCTQICFHCKINNLHI
jgi:hypothetical protein